MTTPQFLTLGEAARRFKIGKATLSRDRKSGRFTAEKAPDGSYRVAVSELLRCYGDRLRPRNGGTGDDNGVVEQIATPSGTPGTIELRARLDAAERMLDERAATIEDLRYRLDEERSERREKDRRLTALLTHERETAAAAERPAGRGWWFLGFEVRRAGQRPLLGPRGARTAGCANEGARRITPRCGKGG